MTPQQQQAILNRKPKNPNKEWHVGEDQHYDSFAHIIPELSPKDVVYLHKGHHGEFDPITTDGIWLECANDGVVNFNYNSTENKFISGNNFTLYDPQVNFHLRSPSDDGIRLLGDSPRIVGTRLYDIGIDVPVTRKDTTAWIVRCSDYGMYDLTVEHCQGNTIYVGIDSQNTKPNVDGVISGMFARWNGGSVVQFNPHLYDHYIGGTHIIERVHAKNTGFNFNSNTGGKDAFVFMSKAGENKLKCSIEARYNFVEKCADSAFVAQQTGDAFVRIHNCWARSSVFGFNVQKNENNGATNKVVVEDCFAWDNGIDYNFHPKAVFEESNNKTIEPSGSRPWDIVPIEDLPDPREDELERLRGLIQTYEQKFADIDNIISETL